MKAHLLSNGRIEPWPFGDNPLPPNSDGKLIDVLTDPNPTLTATQIFVEGPIVVDSDGQGVPTNLRRTWVVREIDPASIQRAAEIATLISQGKNALANWPPNAAGQLAILKALTQITIHIIEEKLDLGLPK